MSTSTLHTQSVAVAIAACVLVIGCASAAATQNRTDTAAPEAAASMYYVSASDFHLNPFYDPSIGKECACWNSLPHNACLPKNATRGPKPIAQYGCDGSTALVQETVRSMKRAMHRPDFVVLSGDYVFHDTQKWQNLKNATTFQVHEMMTKIIALVINEFRAGYPSAPILASLGNDDFFPDYAQPIDGQQRWLEAISEAFMPVLTQKGAAPDAIDTFRRGGYYRVDYAFKHPRSERDTDNVHTNADAAVVATNAITFLVINTVSYAVKNPFVNCSVRDPNAQFEWLLGELVNAKIEGRTVWIVGHIAPGMDHYSLTLDWADCYNTRYNDLLVNGNFLAPRGPVAAQLFGHEHADLVRMVGREKQPSIPLLLQASVSPIYNNNPAFRVYEYGRPDTNVQGGPVYPLDFSEHNMPLSQNANHYALMFPSAAREYNLTSIMPSQMWNFVNRLERGPNSSAEFSKYWANTVSLAPNPPACDPTCVKNEICSMRYIIKSEYDACTLLTASP